MKIRNKIISLFASAAIIICAAATNVLAQAKNFAGPSLAVTGAFVGNNVDTQHRNGTAALNEPIANFGDNDIAYGLDLAYALPIDNNFLIGLGLTYTLNDTKAGSFLGSIKFEAEDHRSAYIQPTYAFNNSFAAFAKLSYHQLDGVAKTTSDITLPLGGTIGANQSTKGDFEGIGYGFGVKGLINQNIYIQAEIEYVDYDSQGGGSTSSVVQFSPETVSGKISVGYKF
jgi:hypothetical protein